MGRIKRNDFLKMGALTLLSPTLTRFPLKAGPSDVSPVKRYDLALMKKLTTANDKMVTEILPTLQADNFAFSRRIGNDFNHLVSAYVSPDSKYYQQPEIVQKLEIITSILRKFQTEDGTVNLSNLESPPDTGFLIELLGSGGYISRMDKSNALDQVNQELKTFLVRSGEALTTGGVHTPNHRWVISAALSHLYHLYPNKKYTNRIDEWLQEGVFIDEDGHFPERSAIYSGVENAAFITMARLLNRPNLLDPVRKNLEMMYYYMEPNGDLVTTDSRRQDQYQQKSIVSYYLQYRFLAIRDKNTQFAGIARLLEQMEGFENEIINRSLVHFLENPLLQEEMPAAPIPSGDYEKLFGTSHLLRIRRGDQSLTLFGGIDWPVIIASGRSNSPNFFSCRNGDAVLKYLRLSTNFFSMGYFYSDGIRKEGNKYVLYKKLTVPYYQPLPRKYQNSKGDYKLSPSIDNRFWNKMDFENRPVSNVKTMETSLTLEEKDGIAEMSFNITGFEGVAVTIEFCFAEGGELRGVQAAKDNNFFLKEGTGSYVNGSDSIHFGPGGMTHQNITALEGEKYSTHFGSLRTSGMHVYITGHTPFSHKLIIG